MRLLAIARRALVLVAAMSAVLATAAAPAGAAVSVRELPNGVSEVVQAADGALWVAHGGGSDSDGTPAWVERRGPDGSVRRVVIGDNIYGGVHPMPDGSLWVPRITHGAGIVSFFHVLPSGEAREVSELSGYRMRLAGVDGAGSAWVLGWDVSESQSHVFRMNSEGVMEDRGTWGNGNLEGNWVWTLGPDGNLWESGRNRDAGYVARLTTSGAAAGRVDMFTPELGEFGPGRLQVQAPVPGPAGALWSVTGEYLLRITPEGQIGRLALASGSLSLSQLAGRPGGPLWAVHGGFAKLEDDTGESETLGAVGTLGEDGTFRGLGCLLRQTVAVASAMDQTGAVLVVLWHTEDADAAGDRKAWLYRVEPGTAPRTGCPVDPGPLAVKVLGPAIGPGRFGSLKFRVHVNRAASVSFTRGKITIGSGRSVRRFGFGADGVDVRRGQTKTITGFGRLRNGFGGDQVARAIKDALRRGKRVRLCLRAKAYHDPSGTDATSDWCGRVRRP